MGKLFQELKQRKVLRVAAIYIVVAWLIIQVADTISPLLNLSLATPRLVLLVLIILFPVSLILAWFFDITQAGVKIQSGAESTPARLLSNRQTIGYGLTGLLGVVATFFLVNLFVVSEVFPPDTGQQELASSEPTVASDVAFEPGQNSIAVLPFADMSAAGDQEYMSDGLAEELLNLLAKIPSLQVTARTSAFSFKGTDETIPEIARQLNVAYVLEGSVRTAGDQIRITTQLIESSTDIHVWSETYTRELDDIFAIQDEIAAQVVAMLEVTLTGGMPVAHKVDAEVYALFLQAEYFIGQSGGGQRVELWEQGVELLDQVLALAPTYVPALVLKSDTFDIEGEVLSDEVVAGVRTWLDRALANDPNYAPAIAKLGMLAISQGDLTTAALHATRALTLSPANPDALFAAARLSNALGRTDEYIRLAEFNALRDPVDLGPHVILGITYQMEERFDDSIAEFRTAMALAPGLDVHTFISLNLLEKGELQAALLEAELADSNNPMSYVALVRVYDAMGERERSDLLLQELIEASEATFPYLVAMAVAGLEDKNDLAFEYLSKAFEVNDPYLEGLLHNASIGKLAADPRWLPFLEENGRSPQQMGAIEFKVTLPES